MDGPSGASRFMRFIAPITQSLSASAENLPKPLIVTNLVSKNVGRKTNTVSKCQSID